MILIIHLCLSSVWLGVDPENKQIAKKDMC